MANKYIIHGATFNGDGTSSALATVDGGVGAWNNIEYFDRGFSPLYGTIEAGDNIFIRSLNASNSPIVRDMATNWTGGSTAATITNRITWIIDNGEVWSGIDGVITYNSLTSLRTFGVAEYNTIWCKTRGSVYHRCDLLNPGDGTRFFLMNSGVRLLGVKVETVQHNAASTNRVTAFRAVPGSAGGHFYVEDPIIRIAQRGTSGSSGDGSIFSFGSANGVMTIVNPEIELWGNLSREGVFDVGNSNYKKLYRVYGGKIFGSAATTGMVLTSLIPSTSASSVRAIGLEYPREMEINFGNKVAGNTQITPSEFIGCDGGVGTSVLHHWGFVTSRLDNNPPYLSAQVPNSTATPWSWRVWPNNVSGTQSAELPMTKLYTGDNAILDISVETLIADSFVSNFTKLNTYIAVTYVDADTSATKYVCSKVDSGALDNSSADWSATTWGLVSLVKKKLSITTSTSVKKDSLISVVLFSEVGTTSDLEIYFVDPDFSTTVV